jgi:hypothetical protein
LVNVIGDPCDLLTYYPSRAILKMIDVKNGPKATWTPKQLKFIAQGWPIERVESVEGALQTCCGIRGTKYEAPQ